MMPAGSVAAHMDLRRVPWRLRHDLLRRAGSRWRRLVVRATHRHATVVFHGGAHLGPGFTLSIPGQGRLEVGEGVEFRRGFTCEIAGHGRVTIGAGTIFTYDTIIQCSTSIDIGERCMIGRALIADGNHRFRDPDVPVAAQGYDFRPVTIGDQTLITTHAVVTASVGRRSFVAANSVVTTPMPDFSLVAGTPARAVEYYGPADGDPDACTPPRHLSAPGPA